MVVVVVGGVLVVVVVVGGVLVVVVVVGGVLVVLVSQRTFLTISEYYACIYLHKGVYCYHHFVAVAIFQEKYM